MDCYPENMDKYEFRRQRLIELRDSKCNGNAAELSRKIEREPSYVTRMLYPEGKAGRKRIADDMIEIIENAFDVPGWFDHKKVRVSTVPATGEVSIERLSARGSMGPGHDLSESDHVVGQLTLSATWIQQTLTRISGTKNLRVISAYGDSMSPTFNDGDMLLVDIGIKSVEIDGVFVLRTNSRLYIKRVRQKLDGAFEVRSDNPVAGTPEELSGKTKVEILGRVVWAWNGRRL